MRRLPVYVLLDVSGSMMGEPIEAVKNGIQTLSTALRKDPYALETAYISIITFSSEAKQVVPLTEVALFQPPTISAGGGTALGEVLGKVVECARNEVQKTSSAEKGDWKPIVFIMTDGIPTDEIKQGLEAFHSYKWGIVVACAAGDKADKSVLEKITENVVSIDTTDSDSIKVFFKWVSSSISTSSKKIEQGELCGDLSELPPPPSEITLPTT